jgi:branched-chain amino acid transport system ATP-binding protein
MSVAAAVLTPLLQLRGIETFYGKIQALRGVDIDVNKGEIVTLIGANGAGKSTTMMTIFGAPRARHGRITFDGHDITNLPTHMIARLCSRTCRWAPRSTISPISTKIFNACSRFFRA